MELKKEMVGRLVGLCIETNTVVVDIIPVSIIILYKLHYIRNTLKLGIHTFLRHFISFYGTATDKLKILDINVVRSVNASLTPGQIDLIVEL